MPGYCYKVFLTQCQRKARINVEAKNYLNCLSQIPTADSISVKVAVILMITNTFFTSVMHADGTHVAQPLLLLIVQGYWGSKYFRTIYRNKR